MGNALICGWDCSNDSFRTKDNELGYTGEPISLMRPNSLTTHHDWDL